MNEDNGSFAAAKLRDYIAGEIKENDDLYSHTGLVSPGSDASELLSFMESIYEPRPGMPAQFSSTSAGETLRRKSATDRVGGSVADIPSFAVGLTDSQVEISEVQAFGKIANSILNEGAPYSSLLFGSMNRGKTGFACLEQEIWKELVPMKYGVDSSEAVVLTNMATLSSADHIVQDVDHFRRLCFGDEQYLQTGGSRGTPPEISPETPKWWHFDECSTHLDARTNSHEVSSLYLPLVKRFAKVRIDGVHLGHSGMDIHADMRRSHISTEFIFKTGLKTAEVFSSMMEDQGSELKYELHEIPETSIEYDADDYSPWSW